TQTPSPVAPPSSPGSTAGAIEARETAAEAGRDHDKGRGNRGDEEAGSGVGSSRCDGVGWRSTGRGGGDAAAASPGSTGSGLLGGCLGGASWARYTFNSRSSVASARIGPADFFTFDCKSCSAVSGG